MDDSLTFRVFDLQGFSRAIGDAIGHYWFNLKGRVAFPGSEC